MPQSGWALPARLSPFYEVEDVVEHIEQYIKERCSDFRFMECTGYMKYGILDL